MESTDESDVFLSAAETDIPPKPVPANSFSAQDARSSMPTQSLSRGAADVRPRDRPASRPAATVPFPFLSTALAPKRRLTSDEQEVYESLSDHGYGPTTPHNPHYVNRCE